MRTIIVNSDAASKEKFSFYGETTEGEEMIQFFDSAEDAIRYAEKNPVDLTIMDTKMLEEKQAWLGCRLKNIQPNMIFIYINTANQESMNTLKQNVIAYFLKSFPSKNIISNPSNLFCDEKPAKPQTNPSPKKVFARTFGHFDLFINGQPVIFQNRKAKELLAMLVDCHGSTVTTEQAISILWENRPSDTATRNLCNKAWKSLSDKLDCLGIGDILIWERGIKSIDVSKIDCDLYDFLDGSQEAIDQFFGEYMMEYSWAEVRVHNLCRMQANYSKKQGLILQK